MSVLSRNGHVTIVTLEGCLTYKKPPTHSHSTVSRVVPSKCCKFCFSLLLLVYFQHSACGSWLTSGAQPHQLPHQSMARPLHLALLSASVTAKGLSSPPLCHTLQVFRAQLRKLHRDELQEKVNLCLKKQWTNLTSWTFRKPHQWWQKHKLGHDSSLPYMQRSNSSQFGAVKLWKR